MRYILAAVFALTSMIGCTAHKKWEVGDKTVHLLAYEGFAGPNVSTVWVVGKDGVARPVYNASGTGAGPAIISGGAQVGSAYYIGRGIGDSGDRTNITSGANASGGEGGNASGGNATGGAGGNATGGAGGNATGGEGGAGGDGGRGGRGGRGGTSNSNSNSAAGAANVNLNN